MRYYRLCRSLQDVGVLIPQNEDVYKHVSTGSDWYKSIYTYSEEQKSLAEELLKVDAKTRPRGVAGITDVVTPLLVFDFDAEKHLDEAQKSTVTLCARLIESGIEKEAIQICFSGGKGFSVVVETTESFSPEQHKTLAKKFAGDLPHFDPKVYNASRIFRVPFTKHQETGLHKIPLTLNELSEASIDEIQTWAKNDYEPNIPETWQPVRLPASLLITEEAPSEKMAESVAEALDLSKKPSWLSNWKYALLNGYFPQGTRSYALMILAATFKNQGLPKDIAYRMLKGAAEMQAKLFNTDRFPDRELFTTVLSQVYGPFWKGGTYAEDNFPDDLKAFLEERGVPRNDAGTTKNELPLVNIDDVYNTFENFAENIDKNTIKTGINEFDERFRITTSMLVGLLGAPGSSKTSLATQILEYNSLKGEEGLFLSLDMGAPLVYQRLAQRVSGLSSDDLFEAFKKNDTVVKSTIRDKIKQNFSNVTFSFRTGASVEEMKNYVIEHQNRTGKKVRLIVVDYLEKIMGGFADATANSAAAAAKLQGMANELDACVIVLLQPQKAAGDPSEPLTSYRRIKGASVIEQDCRFVMSIHRPGYSSATFENDKFLSINVLKNTMGMLGQVDCAWNGLRGQIDELDDAGKDELASLRKQIELAKKAEDEGDGW